MEFVMPIPKSYTKRATQALLSSPTPHVKMVDIDNIFKLYSDSMNGIVYVDDSQVFHIECSKYYGAIPGTFITVNYSSM
jgi:Holliday junction resolvase RusA-like endonuclease